MDAHTTHTHTHTHTHTNTHTDNLHMTYFKKPVVMFMADEVQLAILQDFMDVSGHTVPIAAGWHI